MKAITTKYHGPTDRRGSRVTASAGRNRVTLPYDAALDSDEMHDAAAIALCRKLNWAPVLMRGTVEDAAGRAVCNVYTFVADSNVVNGGAR